MKHSATESIRFATLRAFLQKEPTGAEYNGLISRGLEKEGLRVLPNTEISQSDHPKALGHPLTHASITTDYSEALLELITPVKGSRDALFEDLERTHKYVLNNIGEELLWPGSMPCKLAGNESVRIAEYGDSNIGKLKHVYRKGLDVRYGRIMQSIAGLHFNFSISEEFWEALHQAEQSSLSMKDFKSDKYFALTRNFRRYSWLLMYLFGASPALDASFLDGQPHNLEPFDDKGTFFKPYATSLRMSDLGYTNNAQSSLNICFNTLENFTTTLAEATHTSYLAYEKIGTQQDGEFIQLNTNILQIENEYYSPLRPKRTTHSGEKPTSALAERGVEYIEVRCLDLNPYLALGIDKTETAFMDCFLLYCLVHDSPILSAEACAELEENFAIVSTDGRRPNLTLSQNSANVELTDWAEELLQNIAEIASLLDEQEGTNQHSAALDAQKQKVINPDLCPSAQVLSDMNSKRLSWLEFATNLAQEHKQVLLSDQQLDDIQNHFSELAEQSLEQERALKMQDSVPFAEFLSNYVA